MRLNVSIFGGTLFSSVATVVLASEDGSDSSAANIQPPRILRPENNPNKPASDSATTIHPVIIIGAGMAGASAARQLADLGIDYLWLEGRDKMGGRMRLSEDKLGGEDGVYVEEGANWTGGFTGNPIVKLLDKFKIQYHFQKFEKYDFFKIDADATATKLLRKDIPWGPFYDAYYCLNDKGIERSEAIAALASGEEEPEDPGVRAVLEECGWFKEDYDETVADAVEFFSIDYEWMNRPSEVSMNSIPEYSYGYDFLTNIGFVTDEGGYRQVAERYVESIPQPMFHTEVTQVNWQKKAEDEEGDMVNVAEVVTSEGNFLAKKVILTVSIGVLDKRENFLSPIPIEKLQAMNNVMKPGFFIKVFFKFDVKFWDQISFIFTASENTAPRRCKVWQVEDGAGTNDASSYWYDSNIIFCTLVNDDIDEIGGFEAINDAFIDSLLDDLRDSYGELPAYESYYKNWEEDKWTNLSIESWKKGGTTKDHDTFIAPLSVDGENIVYMAGSATCARHYGWVHGAYFSGYHAARTAANELLGLDLDASTLCTEIPETGFGRNPFRQMVNKMG